jgi:predicted RNA-binding Zn ribbon-like protein
MLAAMAKKDLPPRGPQLDLAGALGVAFVNTAAARPENRQVGVRTYEELLTWSQQTGVVSTVEAESLRRRAAERPEEAAAALARAVELRAALIRLFLATAADAMPTAADLDAVNRALAAAMPARRLVPGETGLVWGWGGDADALDRVLWPLVESAAELLISTAGRPHVRRCAAVDCGLFFVDRSSSRQRKWCEMKTCGNRVKSLRHYHRLGKGRRRDHFRKLGLWHNDKPRPSTKL